MKKMLVEELVHFTVISECIFNFVVFFAYLKKMVNLIDTRVANLSQKIGVWEFDFFGQNSRAIKLVNIPFEFV
jgi:hypothetical protein